MNRYQTLTGTTASVAGGATGQFNLSVGLSLFNILKIKITQNTVGGTLDLAIYKKDTFLAAGRVIRFDDQTAPALYPVDITTGSEVEILEGAPLPYDDDDDSGELHLAITNNDSGAHTYTYTITYEEVPKMSAAGGMALRAAATVAGVALALSSIVITAGVGLTGGGDLSANRSFAVDTSVIATRSYADSAAAALLPINLASQVTGTLPIANGGTGLTVLGAGVQTFLGTPSSANLAAAVTGETGSGALVFGTSPTITTSLTVNGTVFDSATGQSVKTEFDTDPLFVSSQTVNLLTQHAGSVNYGVFNAAALAWATISPTLADPDFNVYVGQFNVAHVPSSATQVPLENYGNYSVGLYEGPTGSAAVSGYAGVGMNRSAVTQVSGAQGLATAEANATIAVGGYFIGKAASSATVASLYGSYSLLQFSGTSTSTRAIGSYVTYQTSGSPTVPLVYGFYSTDLAGVATNGYYFWGDSQGVFRIREDNDVDPGNAQAVLANYNPRVTKYVAGAANFERGVLHWNTNVLQFGAEKGGTGTLRSLQLLGASITTTGTFVQTSASATAFTLGPNGLTSPTLQVATNTASAITGVLLTAKASGGGIEFQATGGTHESMTFKPKGNGSFVISGSTTAYLFDLTSTTAHNFNIFRSTSGTAEFGLFAERLYFSADSLSDGIQFYPAGGATNAGIGISNTGKVSIGFGTGAATYSLQVAPTSNTSDGLTGYFKDARASVGITGVVIDSGAAQSTNPVLTANGILRATKFNVNGTAGANFSGVPASITVVDGLVTAVS